ncbi:MAG: gamma-glutamyltransferase [Alcanivoracaceae bacterium]|jgi:gamma-glutamyltranspeptidase/glutathione hydrolase|nr:gamma-glutamyltransferase [Alcanivoracaceae bacterium]
MRHAVLAFLLVIAFPLNAKTPPAAAIASAHPLATQAGFDILDAGGNAFDAAVAVAAVLAVVEPYSAGMGGGGFWLLHRASDQHEVMLDARETAPAAATADMYQDEDGTVVRDWAINGPAAAGIPGQAEAFAHLAAGYGRLPLADVLAPAIRIAREGFAVDDHYRKLANYRKDALNRFPQARAIFLTNGEVPHTGYLLQQPDLAGVLEAIAANGRDGFYAGEVAKKLVEGVQFNGGLWTLDDLKNYRVIERAPVVGSFRGARIVSAAPPSSGGVVLLEALAILDQVTDGSTSEADFTHRAVEAMRRAYRDRALYLGDPDFVSMPLEKLLSSDYAAAQAATIDARRATPSDSLGDPVTVQQGNHTTHLSVLDMEGNRVSATLSINLPFGSAFVPAGTGVVLNNEMDDFSAKPGVPNAYGLVGSEANAIAPGKRPLSSMTPTFVEFDNKVAILGTPGGSRIISMVMLGVIEALKGTPPQQWVSAPRFHHQYLPDRVHAEPSFVGGELAKSLRLKGHQVDSTGRPYGNMQAILWDSAAGTVQAAADPRAIGKSKVRPTRPRDLP